MEIPKAEQDSESFVVLKRCAVLVQELYIPSIEADWFAVLFHGHSDFCLKSGKVPEGNLFIWPQICVSFLCE